MAIKYNVPYYLEAKSKEDLYLLMHANNRKFKKHLHYFDFTFAQGKWTCWFEIPLADKLEKADVNKE